ncbi:PRC-barrel domain-containing protein [Ciceribacter sp. L1K22]|uniref:PRC-barrel domain-containing protein n=1 Tax=Ciceribacter sp. L1K22 TaxID=2820275 RepID=UPI001ABE3C7D|nr:PRC-barrel domain-containing protein [Ciceribacter sp. L1K22]MBO3760472.1 PRC-barrel domain-containing protein [Ciceribacter sp. L1K22]
MTKRFLSVLMLSAAFPMAAMAQTTADPATPDAGMTQTETQVDGSAKPVPTDAQADTSADMTATTQMAGAGETFVTVPETGAWRVSDFEGKSVYGSDGESIGEINDVLVSQDGSINAVIIGVGGFLGIGEKDVAVNMAALQLKPGMTQTEANQAAEALPDADAGVSDETTASTTPDTSASTAGSSTTEPAMPADGTAEPMAGDQMAANDANDVEIGEDGLPDRIILNVTREELENAPAFEGVRAEGVVTP